MHPKLMISQKEKEKAKIIFFSSCHCDLTNFVYFGNRYFNFNHIVFVFGDRIQVPKCPS